MINIIKDNKVYEINLKIIWIYFGGDLELDKKPHYGALGQKQLCLISTTSCGILGTRETEIPGVGPTEGFEGF